MHFLYVMGFTYFHTFDTKHKDSTIRFTTGCIGQAEQTCWLNYIGLIGFSRLSLSAISIALSTKRKSLNRWSNISSERTRLIFVFYAQTFELSIKTRKQSSRSRPRRILYAIGAIMTWTTKTRSRDSSVNTLLVFCFCFNSLRHTLHYIIRMA